MEWTQTQVRLLIDKATALHHRYLNKTNDYSEALLDHYESYYNELSSFIKRIRDGLEDGVNRFGVDFEKPISTTENSTAFFPTATRKLWSPRKNRVIFDDMRKAHNLRKYFEFDFPAYFDLKNIKKVSESTRHFESAMRLWRRRIPAGVREDLPPERKKYPLLPRLPRTNQRPRVWPRFVRRRVQRRGPLRGAFETRHADHPKTPGVFGGRHLASGGHPILPPRFRRIQIRKNTGSASARPPKKWCAPCAR